MTTQERFCNIEFKVAQNAADAEAKKFHIIKSRVKMSTVSQETLDKIACSAQVVRWQAEIRAKWGIFVEKGFPAEVDFGGPVYGTSRGVAAAITVDKAASFVNGLTPLQKLNFTIDRIREMGMEIPESMLDELDRLEEVENAQ